MADSRRLTVSVRAVTGLVGRTNCGKGLATKVGDVIRRVAAASTLKDRGTKQSTELVIASCVDAICGRLVRLEIIRRDRGTIEACW